MTALTPRLETSIRTILQPFLREDGFAGSGRTFRRVLNGSIQVVNIQGSSYGGQFAINLGVHPLTIPDVLGKMPDPKKITECDCEFRRRLAEVDVDQWWKYENSQSSMDAAVKQAAEVYVRVGRPLLLKVVGDHSPFATISAADFITDSFDLFGFANTTARMSLAFARLRRAEGKIDESRAFAIYGLGHVERASALRTALVKLSGLALT